MGKQFIKYFLLITGVIFCFWFFAYFKTENKPIFVPLYVGFDINNRWWLLPIIIPCYYFLYKSLLIKKPKLITTLLLAFLGIILLNSLKPVNSILSSLQDSNDYYHDAQQITDLKRFLILFDHRIFYYALHTRTHPPGPVIFHYLINLVSPNQLIINALVMMTLSVLMIIVVYKISSIFKSQNPFFNLLLLLSSPAFLLYGATSMDAIFALLISLSILGLLLINNQFHLPKIFLVSQVIFLSLFFTYAAAIIPLFALFFQLLNLKSKNLLKAQFIIWPLVLLDYLIINQLTGFKPIASFFAARNFNTMLMPNIFMTPKRYLFSVTANLVEFIIFLGPAIFTLLILQIKQLFSIKKLSLITKYYLTILGPILFMNFIGLYKTGAYSGETGRIWLFLVPLIIAGIPTQKRLTIKIASLISFTQTIIMALLFNIYW